MLVLAIDPGRDKCGLAIVGQAGVLSQVVLPRSNYLPFVLEAVHERQVKQIILGDGTGSAEFLAELSDQLTQVPIQLVDEKFTTEEARKRYWQEHKPLGFRRLLPRSLQVPPEPYDDYVAVILAERFLAKTT